MEHHYIIPIFVAHEGCPNTCVFCNQHKISGQKTKVTYQDVIDKVEEYRKTFKKKDSIIEIAFFGGSFTGIDKEYQIELLSAAKKCINEGKADYIRISTRPDYIDKEILQYLKEYGVKIIELGVQSMDEEVLILSKRGHSSEDVIKASKLIKEKGFILGHQMMVGLPGDSKDKVLDTAEKLIKLKPDIIRIYPVLVIEGTELEYMYNSQEYNPMSISETVDICKKLLLLFYKENIKVIRLGLQPTEEISENGVVVAGPFHPSFRELVESEMFFEIIEQVIVEQGLLKEKLEIHVNPKDYSKAVGNKKNNINKIMSKYNIDLVINSDDKVIKDELVIICDNKFINKTEKIYKNF